MDWRIAITVAIYPQLTTLNHDFTEMKRMEIIADCFLGYMQK